MDDVRPMENPEYRSSRKKCQDKCKHRDLVFSPRIEISYALPSLDAGLLKNCCLVLGGRW